MTRPFTKLGFIVGFLAASALSQTEAASSSVDFGVGGTPAFCVPKTDLFPGEEKKGGLKYQAGDSLFIFEISGSRIKKQLPEYKRVGQTHGALSGTVGLLSDSVRRELNDQGKYRDLWLGTGPYAAKQVTKIGGTDFWKVRRDDEKSSWRITRGKPAYDAAKAIPNDFVVANCHTLGVRGDRSSCLRQLIDGNALVSYYFDEANANVIEMLDGLVGDRIASWRSACKDSRSAPAK